MRNLIFAIGIGLLFAGQVKAESFTLKDKKCLTNGSSFIVKTLEANSGVLTYSKCNRMKKRTLMECVSYEQDSDKKIGATKFKVFGEDSNNIILQSDLGFIMVVIDLKAKGFSYGMTTLAPNGLGMIQKHCVGDLK